jgi:hypothetical protein
MSKKPAPEKLTLAEALSAPMPAFNVALEINRPNPDIPSKEPNYNSTTDDGLASLRSKHTMRTRDEIEAARSGDLPLGDGLSLRQPMAGQGENNQFPVRTNQYGKQRA